MTIHSKSSQTSKIRFYPYLAESSLHFQILDDHEHTHNHSLSMADVQQPQQHAAPSARAKHTKLALSKALNVTINRAPMQASLRKMLQRSKSAKRRKSSAGGSDHDELLQGFLGDDDDGNDNSKADEALAQVILGVCEDAEVRVCTGRIHNVVLECGVWAVLSCLNAGENGIDCGSYCNTAEPL